MMNHELRAELANAKLRVRDLESEVDELRNELGQCSRELLACSATLDEKRKQLLELTDGYEQGVAWASGKRDAAPMMGASEMQAMGIVSTPFPMPAPEPGVAVITAAELGPPPGHCDCPGPTRGKCKHYSKGRPLWDESDLIPTRDDLPEEEPNLNTPDGDSDFEVIP